MNPTAIALTGYILWTLSLLGGILGLRTYLTLTGQRPANRFKPDGSDVSPFAERLSGAHANCYESFPVLGGLLLLALATDTQRLTDPLALVVLAGRLGQSTVHLLSIRVTAVLVRFACFLVQTLIAAYWAFRFLAYFSTVGS
ncbi:MAG: MAPEG family protein [Candidatus Competibacteraceae bacterium]